MQHQMHNFLPAPFVSKVPGIYAIVNRNNSKVYIGSAMKLFKRWNSHRHDFFKNRQNPHLMRAFKKDPSAFYIEVVEELPGANKEKRLEREQFWMNFYQSYDRTKGYNLCPKAESCEGAKHAPEYGAAVSARQKGKKWSEEKKAHYRAVKTWPRGWRWSDENKKKLSDAHKGQKWTENQRLQFKQWILAHPNHTAKAVIQMSASGEEIRRFDSIRKAEAYFGKRSNIHAICKGKNVPSHGVRQFCFGFRWKYAE